MAAEPGITPNITAQIYSSEDSIGNKGSAQLSYTAQTGYSNQDVVSPLPPPFARI